MSKIPRFAACAATFEKSVASDDWSLLEPFFTEAAVYDTVADPPLGGRIEGRAAVLAWFKDILDRFDRRFESREVALLEGPKEIGDAVWIRGSATYRAKGVPNPHPDVEKTLTDKAQIVKALAESIALCDEVFGSLTEQNAQEYVRQGPAEVPRIASLMGLLAHDAEMFGISTVYLRARNLVPPGSDR